MSNIKRIRLKDLRLGMYLHGFDGSWMTHPFWRCGFVLQKQADLRLKGEAISLMARMAAVCDVYDAITSNRPYKGGWDPAVSVARMISWKGYFDQVVLSAFIKTLGIYPTGALVKMKSGRLAVVLEQNQGSLTKPVVKVFLSSRDKTYLPPKRLDLALPGAADSIAGTEARANWDFKILDDRWAGDLASGAA